MLAPIPQQDAAHLDQPQVVSGLLVVAHQDGPALREQAQRTVDPLSPRRVTLLATRVLFLFSYGPDVRGVAVAIHHFPSRLFVVTRIQPQVLGCLLGRVGTLHYDITFMVSSSNLKSGTFAPATTTAKADHHRPPQEQSA